MKRAIFIILLGACVLACASTPDASVRAPALHYDLTSEELQLLKSEALRGRADSARRIADFRIFVESDEDDYYFWLRLSAELGHCNSMIRLSQWYRARSKASDRAERSSHWENAGRSPENCGESGVPDVEPP